MPRQEPARRGVYPRHVNTPELREEWDNSSNIRAAWDECFKQGADDATHKQRVTAEQQSSGSSRGHKEPRSSNSCKHRDHDEGGGGSRPAQSYDSQRGGGSHRDPYTNDPYSDGSAPHPSHRKYRSHDEQEEKEARRAARREQKAREDADRHSVGRGRPTQSYDLRQAAGSHRNPYANDSYPNEPYAGRSSKAGTSHSSGRGGRMSINRSVLQDQFGYVNQHPVKFGECNRREHPQFAKALKEGVVDHYWYHVIDLEMTLRDLSHQPLMSLLDGQTRLQQVLQSPVPNATSQADWEEVLNDWMNIFDHAYFFGLVRQITGAPHFTPLVSAGAVGHEQRGLACYSRDTRQITFDMNAFQREISRHPLMLEFAVGSLLHEMLHGFIDLYSCRCFDCYTMHPNQGGLGKGHGPSWANSMVELQDGLQKAVRWRVCCAVQRAVHYECGLSGWTLSAEERAAYLGRPD